MWRGTHKTAFAVRPGRYDSALAAGELRGMLEDGRRVLLMPDGKWRFDTTAGSSTSASPSADQSPYQPTVKKFSVAFDTSKGALVAPSSGQPEGNKKTFRHKTLPISGIVVSDEIPATTAAMKNVIFYNARSAGAEIKVLQDGSKTIGDKSVGALRFAASTGGLDGLTIL